MRYVIVSEAADPLVMSALESMKRLYVDSKPRLEQFERHLYFRTQRRELSKIVDINFQELSREKRRQVIENAIAYPIVEADLVDLNNPIKPE